MRLQASTSSPRTSTRSGLPGFSSRRLATRSGCRPPRTVSRAAGCSSSARPGNAVTAPSMPPRMPVTTFKKLRLGSW